MKKVECQRIDAFELVLEKILESPLDCKEIKPVNLISFYISVVKIQDSVEECGLARRESNITQKWINELAIIFEGYV